MPSPAFPNKRAMHVVRDIASVKIEEMKMRIAENGRLVQVEDVIPVAP